MHHASCAPRLRTIIEEGKGVRGALVWLSVFWIPGYPGPPAFGPLQWPSFGPRVKQWSKPNGEDPHEEAPHEENDN
jgi:hypothetical protein